MLESDKKKEDVMRGCELVRKIEDGGEEKCGAQKNIAAIFFLIVAAHKLRLCET